jgi:hypothetical protein
MKKRPSKEKSTHFSLFLVRIIFAVLFPAVSPFSLWKIIRRLSLFSLQPQTVMNAVVAVGRVFLFLFWVFFLQFSESDDEFFKKKRERGRKIRREISLIFRFVSRRNGATCWCELFFRSVNRLTRKQQISSPVRDA